MENTLKVEGTSSGTSALYDRLGRVLPCPNGCRENLYHNGYYVVCQICGLRGPEQDGGSARQATDRWNALPRPNAALSGAEPALSAERPLEGTVRGENPGDETT